MSKLTTKKDKIMKPHEFDRLQQRKKDLKVKLSPDDKCKRNIQDRKYNVSHILVRGIYRLYQSKDLVYIGQSKTNVMSRISDHHYEKIKIFDSFTFSSCDNLTDAELNDLEKKLIKKYSPRYNTIHSF